MNLLTLGLWCKTTMAAPEMIPLEETSMVGRAAPAIALQSLEGTSFSLEEMRGQVVVLAFWASWCGPCRAELPALQQLQQQLSDDERNAQIVLINVDRERQDALRFLTQVGLTRDGLPVLLDNEAIVMGNYGVLSMPTMFLVDQNGTIKFAKTGYSQEKGLVELEAAIQGAL